MSHNPIFLTGYDHLNFRHQVGLTDGHLITVWEIIKKKVLATDRWIRATNHYYSLTIS